MANENSKFMVSEIKVSYHPKVKPSERPFAKNSKDAYEIFLNNWDMGKIYMVEEFKVMYLNRRSGVIGIYPMSLGGITGTIVDPRIILLAAIGCLSTQILLCHNHPSGNLKPSKSDIEATEKVKYAAKYFDIKLLDHLIISDESYYSFADEGEI